MGLAIAAVLLSGCANKPDAISGTEEQNPLISSSYVAAGRLLTAGGTQVFAHQKQTGFGCFMG